MVLLRNAFAMISSQIFFLNWVIPPKMKAWTKLEWKLSILFKEKKNYRIHTKRLPNFIPNTENRHFEKLSQLKQIIVILKWLTSLQKYSPKPFLSSTLAIPNLKNSLSLVFLVKSCRTSQGSRYPRWCLQKYFFKNKKQKNWNFKWVAFIFFTLWNKSRGQGRKNKTFLE